MNIDVQKVTTDGYWGAVWMQGSPFNVTTWNMRPTANIMMTLAYKGDSNWNETFWKSEKFDKTLVEVIEIKEHPWFIGCQFHPEFTSEPRKGHPLFAGFIKAAKTYKIKS